MAASGYRVSFGIMKKFENYILRIIELYSLNG